MKHTKTSILDTYKQEIFRPPSKKARPKKYVEAKIPKFQFISNVYKDINTMDEANIRP